MLNLLKTNDIELILVLTPLTDTYYKMIDDKLKKAYKKAIADTCSKYRYIDMNQLSEIKFEDKDFVDCDHLNPNGAKKFTKYISNFIKKK